MEEPRKSIMTLFRQMKEGGSEELFRTGSLSILLEKLKTAPNDEKKQLCRVRIRSILDCFCYIFMACLANLRSSQPAEAIDEMEKALRAIGKEVQLQFINLVLKPFCAKLDQCAIEILGYFLYSPPGEILERAKEVLIETGRNKEGKKMIAEILLGHIPGESYALGALAKVNTKAATEKAFKLIKKRDEDILCEALQILVETPLKQDLADMIVEYLKSDHSDKLWTEVIFRQLCYGLIKHLFDDIQISTENELALLKKAFLHEGCEGGLHILLPLIANINPKDKQQLLFDGFSTMEARGNYEFSTRKDSVEKFLSQLNKTKLIGWLQNSLLQSKDEKFIWFAGKRLLIADIGTANETFLQMVKNPKNDASVVGTLAQLAIKACDGDEEQELQPDDEGYEKLQSPFAPVARALFRYAESADIPIGKLLAIAIQPTMFGGHPEFCSQAVTLMQRILLYEEGVNPGQMLQALRALLNCQVQRTGPIVTDVTNVLQQLYRSKYKEQFLGQLLHILSGDIRGYPMEPLYPPIVDFLTKIKPADAVPILQKALAAHLPNGDLGLHARASYVTGLIQFAIAGNVDAVSAIAKYRGGNIHNGIIPATLAKIHAETFSEETKKKVTTAVAERFLLSIKNPSDSGASYFNEVDAIEALKTDPFIQSALLKGIRLIGDIKSGRTSGMSKIIEKVPAIIPEERKEEARGALNRLLEKLTEAKKAYIDEYAKGHHGRKPQENTHDYLRTADTIYAQASLTLIEL